MHGESTSTVRRPYHHVITTSLHLGCGPEPGAQVLEPPHLTPALRAPPGRPSTVSSVLLSLSFSVFLSVCLEVTVTSLHLLRLCRLAVFSLKPPLLSLSSTIVSLFLNVC